MEAPEIGKLEKKMTMVDGAGSGIALAIPRAGRTSSSA